MRVLVTGAGGAVGLPLVAQLLGRGHEVVGTSRTPEGAARIRELGAEARTLDLLDPPAVRRVVHAARPDAVVHEATALAGIDLRRFAKSFAETNRLRTEGTDALLAAASDAGVHRFVAQSFAGWMNAREGGPVKTEADPPDPHPPAAVRETVAAIRRLERTVDDFGGAALRYGAFYGAPSDVLPAMVRARRLPVVGGGHGVWSFIHVADAAAATVLALEQEAQGVFNVADDDPAPVRVWLPALAAVLGAPPPRRLPAWVGRLLAGEAVVLTMTEARGVSNAKARRELGWAPRYASWRDGFRAAYVGREAPAGVPVAR